MISKNIINKIVWLTPYGQDKLWDPALRLRRVNVHNQFLKMGINSNFIFNCLGYSDEYLLKEFEDSSIVVFTEQSEREFNLIKEARKRKILTMRDHCEYMFGLPYQDECFRETDLIVCSSTIIAKESIKRGYRICVIPDMWEPTPLCTIRDTSDNLRAIYMGSQGPLRILLNNYGNAIKEAGYELDIITDIDGIGKRWSLNTWVQDYIHADISLCPQDIRLFPGKSNVKVAQSLGTGYPTIASPLQSYKEVFDGGICGIIAYSPEQWKEALIYLKDPIIRLKMHSAAILQSNRYSPENISKMWYAQMLSLINKKAIN